MSVRAVVKAGSVETLYPDPALDFNAVIAGPEFLDAAKFPDITFVSTAVVQTGPNSADVTGDLTLHGVTKPVVLRSLTTAFGLLEVGYPGYATSLAMPALGGLLLSVNSFGSALGGALYGGLALKVPVERQFAATMGLMSLPLAPRPRRTAPRPSPSPAFLAGAAIAPTIASQSVLVSRLAPSHYATEAFTWSSTFIVSGLGEGMALGGWLTERVGTKAPFLAGAACVLAMAALALRLPVARRRGD